MIQQLEITLNPRPRGFHLITDEIMENLISQKIRLPKLGIIQLFIKHTSAGLTINENADRSVRDDFESIFNNLVPENQSYYTHTAEGPDDMPAHIKTSLTGNSISIPISNHEFNMGVWQGIYLCEFRNRANSRKIILTIFGD